MSHKELPENPEKQKDQITQLWDACFNPIPTSLGWLNLKVNFILGLMSVILTIATVSLIVAINSM